MASVPVSCQELAVVEQESEGKGRYLHPAGPCRVTVHAGVGISAAVTRYMGEKRAQMRWIGSLWFRATSMAIFGRPTTYGFCLHFLCVCKEGMAGEEKKTRRFWDQTGVGKGDGRGEVKHRGMESPSLSSGHPFSGEKPACVCRSRLYEVVSSKDSWNNEANPSLYLMRMLFFVVVKWDYHLCLPKRRLCEFHVWGITYAGIVL